MDVPQPAFAQNSEFGLKTTVWLEEFVATTTYQAAGVFDLQGNDLINRTVHRTEGQFTVQQGALDIYSPFCLRFSPMEGRLVAIPDCVCLQISTSRAPWESPLRDLLLIKFQGGRCITSEGELPDWLEGPPEEISIIETPKEIFNARRAEKDKVPHPKTRAQRILAAAKRNRKVREPKR